MKVFTSAPPPAVRKDRDRDRTSHRPRRRRHRRRRRTGRLDHRLPPGAVRARRPAAREDRLPAREGLRRRPDPARGQAAGLPGRRHQPEAGWIHNKGLRIVGGGTASSCPGPTSPPSPTTAWSARALTSTSCWPGRRVKAGARLHERTNVSGPVLDPRTGRILGVTARAGRGRRHQGPRDHLPRAAGRRRRRQLHPAVPGHGPAQARRPPDGRGRPHLLHEPARTTTTGWSPGSSCGTAPARTASCCPATAGSSASATAPSTSASGILNTSTRLRARRLQGAAQDAGSTRRPRSGASATRT